jgi:hypothetical protein
VPNNPVRPGVRPALFFPSQGFLHHFPIMLNYAEFYFLDRVYEQPLRAIANRFTLADFADGDPHLCGDVAERFGAGSVGADGQKSAL